ncbi:biotin/lipoate A/B protein ligase family protein [Gloeocapsa sp. PCC 73106]|uniref:lipoyl protein ligase domain-containing protein n=1 Tax=Gloeocapsa sp. PCC 73106 TaxID=102232 RepID=UPI0002AC3A21|nr:biotin/lipoate A/B protein ligase family protein [Gloeocapsa sp. PCC 73106]ELS00018.1 lipoate-protein ligase A [Gloeocapsa sp. PCC 73106]
MTQIWRYLPLLEASGRVQMAIDTWLLQQHRLGKQPPCLRFYTWSPPAISLGYHQRRYPETWHQITWQGQPLEIVRRPTGGRAVLHDQDLTYAIVTSGIPGRVIGVYHYLSSFLIEAGRSLGLVLDYGQGGKNYLNHANCLATSTPADLVDLTGQKLVGSALLKQGNCYLLHGSLQLATDNQLYTQVFGDLPPVYPAANYNLDTWIKAMLEAAQRSFQIELITQPLLDAEWVEIQTFVSEVLNVKKKP